jgi:hypothetical protein
VPFFLMSRCTVVVDRSCLSLRLWWMRAGVARIVILSKHLLSWSSRARVRWPNVLWSSGQPQVSVLGLYGILLKWRGTQGPLERRLHVAAAVEILEGRR